MADLTLFPPPPIVSHRDGRIITSSLEVARVFKKNHRDVVKAIKNLACSERFQLRNFAQLIRQYEAGKGALRTQAIYEITREGFMLLAMGFTGPEAMQFKEQFIEAFLELERRVLLDPMARIRERWFSKREKSGWRAVDTRPRRGPCGAGNCANCLPRTPCSVRPTWPSTWASTATAPATR